MPRIRRTLTLGVYSKRGKERGDKLLLPVAVLSNIRPDVQKTIARKEGISILALHQLPKPPKERKLEQEGLQDLQDSTNSFDLNLPMGSAVTYILTFALHMGMRMALDHPEETRRILELFQNPPRTKKSKK